ncbi:MAG: hypothetical protein AAFY35_11275 [Pseudomonadota bacterium]
MSELLTSDVIKFLLLVLVLSIPVPAVVTWFLGGKWLWRLWLLAVLGLIAFIFVGYQFVWGRTGMEGLGVVFLMLMGGIASIGTFLAYAMTTMVKEMVGK